MNFYFIIIQFKMEIFTMLKKIIILFFLIIPSYALAEDDCFVREYAQIKDMETEYLESLIKNYENIRDLNSETSDQFSKIHDYAMASQYSAQAKNCSKEILKMDQVLKLRLSGDK